jgi:hypothetical protein
MLSLFANRSCSHLGGETIDVNGGQEGLTTGFPVTIAGEWPWNLEYSSRIQAMV